ncbi:hypothetical protein EXU57_08810 [Segetibacter sp. 3557_3]|uniref:hypothetical protein n=1 Tax=Segetibacter sp. 3557_3 TaxID=2547429 RepID=UPI00105840C0|nr:hypothetical protein [Segetibacter sp. 3557_3]TDH26896.1 hypothetical protein EXU57_08810 [Segetibacter sp. 3557_3]
MKRELTTTLRWICVLPGAIAAGLLSTVILHFVLYTTLSKFVSPYPQLPERALTPFAISLAFVWLGTKIAPNNRFKTGLILFFIWIALALGVIVYTLIGGKLFGSTLDLQFNGVAPLLGILGSVIGILLVKRKYAVQGNDKLSFKEGIVKERQEGEKKAHSTNQTVMLVVDFIFMVLFIVCIYYPTFRIVVFSLLLLLHFFSIVSFIKEQEIATKFRKINFLKEILTAVALIIGLVSQKAGFYVTLICLALIFFDLIRLIVKRPTVSAT